jgi:tRNA/rRNA methyltransferase
MPSSLDSIAIVLVEPAGARNIGSIARVMKNMGLSQLVLVQPQCDWLSDEARHMAVHAADLLEQAVIHENLAAALSKVHRVVATLGRDSDRPVMSPRQALSWVCADAPVPLQSAIIFGREDHGLSNDELKYAQRYLCIPSSPAYQSLNLAQAVGICCYELYLLAMAEDSTPSALIAEMPSHPAAQQQIEGYFAQLENLLLRIGYLHSHTVTSRMAHLRELFKQADPSAHDVAMLRGMIRQIEWAIANPERMTPCPAESVLDPD